MSSQKFPSGSFTHEPAPTGAMRGRLHPASPVEGATQAPKVDNRYDIVRTLGSGLSGDVFEVEDKGVHMALKFLKPVQLHVSRDEALQNFKNEFVLLSELNHPGVARILDFGFDAYLNKYFFTSELINGKDFFAATEGLSTVQIEDLAVQVLRALNYLHTRGLYHLDIKPQNILVAPTSSPSPLIPLPQGERENKTPSPSMGEGRGEGVHYVAKIIDFGLSTFTVPTKKAGTPAYMAPEMILGGVPDGRTDLYSFGIVLYKAFTRFNPFAHGQITETLKRQKELKPEAPSILNPNLPRYWDSILLRMLEKTPSHRYSDAASVIRDINFLGHKNFEIETQESRLSYLPEKGLLIGRKKEEEIFKTLFDMVFVQGAREASHLLIIEGEVGTGKTRLLSEFKNFSQLHNVPVYRFKEFNRENMQPPFCLHIDDKEEVSINLVNLILQDYANEKILILWGTEKAPIEWSSAEKIQLKNFSENECRQYLIMVTGLEDPPAKLVRELYARSNEGNPLFLSEIIKALLASNTLLDTYGRWASSTFEDIGIDFEKLHISQNLSELLQVRIQKMGEKERKILEWLSVLNRPASLDLLRKLTEIPEPQGALLNLTREDVIERNEKGFYFFTNALVQQVIYEALPLDERKKRHDKVIISLMQSPPTPFDKGEASSGGLDETPEILHHMGFGTDDAKAVEAFRKLSLLYAKDQKYTEALSLLEKSWERSSRLPKETRADLQMEMAENAKEARNFKKAQIHYEALKDLYEKHAAFSQKFDKRIQVYERLGDVYVKTDQYQKALKLFDTVLQSIQNIPNQQVTILLIRNHIANVYLKSGQMDKAETLFRENYKLWDTKLPTDQKRQVINNFLADVLILNKKFDEAKEVIERTIEFFKEVNHAYQLARSYYLEGHFYFTLFINAQGEEKASHKQKALHSFNQCLALSKAQSAQDLVFRAYNAIGNIHFYEKEYDEAVQNYQRALTMAQRMADFSTAGALSYNLAHIYKDQSRFQDAYAYLVYALNTLQSLENKNAINWQILFMCWVELAENHRERNDTPKAVEAIKQAEDLLAQHPHLATWEFSIWLQKAKLQYQIGNEKNSVTFLDQAEKLAQEGWQKEEIEKFKTKILPELTTRSSINLPKSTKAEWELETILKINKMLNANKDTGSLYSLVLQLALDLSGAEDALILLYKRKKFVIEASLQAKVDVQKTCLSQTVARKVFETKKPVKIADAIASETFSTAQSIILNQLRSVLALPIFTNEKIIGVLYLDHRHQPHVFDKLNLSLLEAFADQVGIALSRKK